MSNNLTPTGANVPQTGDFATQTDPQSLMKLFQADPEHLSDRDIDAIVGELRRQRRVFQSDEATKALKPSSRKGVTISKEAVEQLNLQDLGL